MGMTYSAIDAMQENRVDDIAVIHKTILVGDSGVGKTRFSFKPPETKLYGFFLVQFDTGKFQPGSFAATVGIGFTNKTVTMADSSKVKLQIWDTAGQERFRSITHAYYRDAHALLLLYDVTSKASFDNIRAWLAEIHDFAQEDAVIILIGNKADVSSARTVRKEDGERLANEFRVTFMETSAKSGLNVENAFRTVASCLRNRQDFPKEKTVRLTEPTNGTPANAFWKCCGY